MTAVTEPTPFDAIPSEVSARINLSEGDCWLWTGSRDVTGYGQLTNGAYSTRQAHRIVWQILVGPIASGMELDHLCHTRECVNPDHLREVTHKQNLENRRGARRTNPTGARGVHRRPSGRFSARARHHGVDYTAGTFATVEEAAEAAARLRARLFTPAPT